ncbi:MAG TPA: sulfatase-like hydrolase/transferase [Candidatus Hydrogenedentes bacterium]|nr:sulfatase-like hydrolase/transferase [Candidatus Hydrogenedentota bacterium]HRT18713.1 sulfatase-like hydrolase/transferase [Candidatus Hydrogenedentota bacterium]HRT63733.1 sulfatase-like hydrolase/transferase [Candidatus Hydrogenedentota bacterium]
MSMQGLTRRRFIGRLGMGLAVAALPQTRASSSSRRPPNILVIMSDEHNATVMGCAGNPVAHTPNLDALAGRGVMFENCYCNSPLCVPSRLSFTSGKYASRVGAWNNDCRLPSPDYPSLPRLLAAKGYEAFLCGKMHYDATCRYGFTEIGGNMNRSRMNGRIERRDPDDLTPKPGLSDRFNEKNFGPGDTSSPMNHDRNVTKGTLDFLRNRKENDPPFMLLAGYLTPHFPLIVPREYWERYKGKVSMPAMPDGFLDTLPLNYRHLRIGFNVEDIPDDIVRKGRELYYGLVQWMDEEIGKVLSCLQDSELAENTVVIYTADHGENMGEHGLWWKNCLYDSAARVPLIVSWPARWTGGQRRTGACSLVDVVQTIAGLGGAQTPKDWDGDSMLDWLDNPKASWKDRAVSEYYAHNIASGYAMIRSGHFKYVYHTPPDEKHPAQHELYDMKADPGEFTNLAGKPEYADRVKALHKALVGELGEDPDKTEQRCRVSGARGYARQAG